MASKVLDVDLAYGLQDINGLSPYRTALVLLRWRGRPLGKMRMDVAGDRIIGRDLWQMARAVLGQQLVVAALDDMLPKTTEMPAPELTLPSCSVVICTRNRTNDLRRCLDSLCATAGPEVEIIVVCMMESERWNCVL